MKKRTEYHVSAWDLADSIHFHPRTARNLRKAVRLCKRRNLQYAVWRITVTKRVHKTERIFP